MYHYDRNVKIKVSMLVIWAVNMLYTMERFSTCYKKIKKYNNLLSDFLEYVIMDRLFKRSVYTVIEIDFRHNAVHSTFFIH